AMVTSEDQSTTVYIFGQPAEIAADGRPGYIELDGVRYAYNLTTANRLNEAFDFSITRGIDGGIPKDLGSFPGSDDLLAVSNAANYFFRNADGELLAMNGIRIDGNSYALVHSGSQAGEGWKFFLTGNGWTEIEQSQWELAWPVPMDISQPN